MVKPAVIESICRFVIDEWILRVWRAESVVLHVYTNDDILKRFNYLLNPDFCHGPRDIALDILQMERVNALELTYQGQGIVLYKEWP